MEDLRVLSLTSLLILIVIPLLSFEDSDDGMITRETVLEVHGSYTEPDLHGSANARLSLYMVAGSTPLIVSRRVETDKACL